MSVDTACSSSLVATNLAHAHVQKSHGSAIVGGINMMLLQSTSGMFQKASMLSPDGRCKTLDASADGYTRAEACTMMLIGADVKDPIAVLAGMVTACIINMIVCMTYCHGGLILHLYKLYDDINVGH